MREPGPITDYLDTVSRALSFDAPLSRRVCREIEDHLWESVSHDPHSDPIEAQRHAITAFGDARAIARQYAASSLFAQARRVGIWVLVALLGSYAAMKGRGVWYGLLQWAPTEHLKAVIATWVTVDLNAFRIALAIGIVSLGYVASRRLPASFHQSYCRQVKRCALLCTVVAGVLLASVMSDIVITGFRVLEAEVFVVALVPLATIAAEIALMATLALHIRTTIRRIALASSLLEN